MQAMITQMTVHDRWLTIMAKENNNKNIFIEESFILKQKFQGTSWFSLVVMTFLPCDLSLEQIHVSKSICLWHRQDFSQSAILIGVDVSFENCLKFHKSYFRIRCLEGESLLWDTSL